MGVLPVFYRVVKCVHIDATNGVTLSFGILRIGDGSVVASGLTQAQATAAVNTLNSNPDVANGNLYFV